MLDFAADRQAAGDAGDLQAARPQHLAEVVGGGLALVGEIGGEDDFLHHAVAGTREQALEMQFLRPDAVERREVAHQHVVHALEGVGLLHHVEVGRHLDDAQQGGVAPGRGTALADLVLAEGVAAAAVAQHFARPAPAPAPGAGRPSGRAAAGDRPCAAPTSARRRAGSAGPRRVPRGATAATSERQLHPRRQVEAGGEAAHLLLHGRLDAAHGVVHRGGDEVLQHVLVVGQQRGIDADAAHVVLAGHDHLDQAGAGLALDLDGRQLLLRLLHVLLHLLGLYFGEEYKQENCEACDNCLHPKNQFEGQDFVVSMLETVLAVKEKHKADHIGKIFAGTMNSAIKSYKHHKLETFGLDEERDERFWNMVIRQALINKLLNKDIENYGLLGLTPKGHQFLEKPQSFMLNEDHDYTDSDDEEASFGARTAAADEELLSILKDLRKKISKQAGQPPYNIFQDPSLEEMAIQYPVTLEELQNITGIGAGKAQRYGKEVVEVIASYVAEKEIIRPQDMVVKSVVNKSGLKVYIIQSIDRKMPFEDIAAAKGIEYEDLLSEIEAIVSSGTKLNIDYYVNSVIDEDRQQDIYSYFMEEAESGSLEEAINELAGEFEEEEIRLVRIKVLAEGN